MAKMGSICQRFRNHYAALGALLGGISSLYQFNYLASLCSFAFPWTGLACPRHGPGYALLGDDSLTFPGYSGFQIQLDQLSLQASGILDAGTRLYGSGSSDAAWRLWFWLFDGYLILSSSLKGSFGLQQAMFQLWHSIEDIGWSLLLKLPLDSSSLRLHQLLFLVLPVVYLLFQILR